MLQTSNHDRSDKSRTLAHICARHGLPRSRQCPRTVSRGSLGRVPVRMRLPGTGAADRMGKMSGRVLLDKVFHLLPRTPRITNPFAGSADRQQSPDGRSARRRGLQLANKRGCFIGHSFAFDELSHLNADIGEGVQQSRIRRSDLAGKEFDDAEHTVRSFNRKAEGGV